MTTRLCLPLVFAAALCAQDATQKLAPRPAEPASDFVIPVGTKIPLGLINSVSTKHAAEGERVYLETVFPIMDKGKIVIPVGSWVIGTITQVKRPGKLKGRGELHLRFDSLTLPNGVTRDFRARVSSFDGRASEEFDKREGKIKSEGDKSGDARKVAEAAGIGASIGAIAGAASGSPSMGPVGMGAGAGAAAALIGVLFSRGPEAVLARGTTLEMVTDRPLAFETPEIDFSGAGQSRRMSDGPGPLPSAKTGGLGSRRF